VIVVAGEQPILDSLRHSTASYVNLLQSVWAQTTGMRADALPAPLGVRAPNLVGDYWFPPIPAGASRPSHGRVSIVEFLGRCCGPVWDEANLQGGIHAADLAVLRRLAKRFPDLEITLVTATQGYAWYALMATPADEAEWVNSLVKAENPPPGAELAIATRPFWRLPAPDLRHITTPVANDTSYSFGKRVSIGETPQAFLLDQDGLLVEVQGLARSDESKLEHLIEALFSRQARAGSAAAPGKPHE
jgi:hypothetical protein